MHANSRCIETVVGGRIIIINLVCHPLYSCRCHDYRHSLNNYSGLFLALVCVYTVILHTPLITVTAVLHGIVFMQVIIILMVLYYIVHGQE